MGASDVWILVPARGGSKGIPRKNVRLLGDKPLVRHVLDELSRGLPRDRIVLSTDDEEIARAAGEGFLRHPRRPEDATDKATLDQVARDAAAWLLGRGAREDDLLLTVQPTSPFLRLATVHEAAARLRAGARSVLTVKDDRHLRWTLDDEGRPRPLFERRVNRQWMPPILAETGGIIGTRLGDLLRSGTRVESPVALLEVGPAEGLDIDSHADWAVAEYLLRRRSILIRADASNALGMGHVYRAIALAAEMVEHDVRVVTRGDDERALGAKFLSQYPFPLDVVQDEEAFLRLVEEARPAVAILDVLDTSEEFVRGVKAHARYVVCLEDLGPGGRVADLVVNDLYTDLYPRENHWYGVQHAILAPQFEAVAPRPVRDSVERILVAFGGTDQHNLTAKTLDALRAIRFAGEVTVVLGPGYSHGPVDVAGLKGHVLRSVRNMAEVMREADVAITSAGRTVTELMTVGVPTIALCQNLRELRHTHASSPFGVLNLGMGVHVDVDFLAKHVAMVVEDPRLRQDMHQRATQAVMGRSNRRLCQRILEAAERSAAPQDRGSVAS